MEIGTQRGEYAQSKENSETKKYHCVQTNPRGMHCVVTVCVIELSIATVERGRAAAGAAGGFLIGADPKG